MEFVTAVSKVPRSYEDVCNSGSNHWNHHAYSRRQFKVYDAMDALGIDPTRYNSHRARYHLLFSQWDFTVLERPRPGTFSFLQRYVAVGADSRNFIPDADVHITIRPMDQASLEKQNHILLGGRDWHYNLRCSGYIASDTMVDDSAFQQNAELPSYENEVWRPKVRAVAGFFSSGCGPAVEHRPVKNAVALAIRTCPRPEYRPGRE